MKFCYCAERSKPFCRRTIGRARKIYGKANINERRLHARHHALDSAFINIAHQTAAFGALDIHLLQHAVFDMRDARLAGCDVD